MARQNMRLQRCSTRVYDVAVSNILSNGQGTRIQRKHQHGSLRIISRIRQPFYWPSTAIIPLNPVSLDSRSVSNGYCNMILPYLTFFHLRIGRICTCKDSNRVVCRGKPPFLLYIHSKDRRTLSLTWYSDDATHGLYEDPSLLLSSSLSLSASLSSRTPIAMRN